MTRAPKSRKAFILLSTIFVILILGFVVRAALIRLPVTVDQRAMGLSGERALQAARSGVAFAVGMLRDDPTWTGGDGRTVVVDEDGLKVTQERGNLIGEIIDGNGAKSLFRIRFNHHDGSGGGDNKDDPSGNFVLDLPHVSVNNLGEEGEVPLPEVDPANGEILDPTGGETIPGRSVILFVEGVSLEPSGRKVTRVVESLYRLAPTGRVKDGAIMAGGDMEFHLRHDGRVDLGGSMIRHSADDLLRLRSKGNISVFQNRGVGSHETGDIVLDRRSRAELGRNEFDGGVQANFDSDRVSEIQEEVGDGRDFYNVTYDQVPKASADPTSRKSIQIPGGVYVYGEKPGDPSTREMRYYDISYDQYIRRAETLENTGHGTVLSPDLAEVRSPENLANVPDGLSVGPAPISFTNPRTRERQTTDGFEWRLKDHDLRVLPSSRGNVGIAVVPRKLPKFDETDTFDYPNVDDKYNTHHMKFMIARSSFTAEQDPNSTEPNPKKGDIRLYGAVSGNGGTVVSDGDVHILAGKAMNMRNTMRENDEVSDEFLTLMNAVDSDDGGDTDTMSSLQLNVYAKGDLSISTYFEDRNSYRDMAFQGLLYSWGDVDLFSGSPNSIRRGSVFLRGAVVAYGGDPLSEEPGGEGGDVRIRGGHAYVRWDPRFLPSITTLQGSEGSLYTLQSTATSEIGR